MTTACTRMAAAVEPAGEAIKDAIATAPVAHFDETVTRVARRHHWLNAAATGRLTAYHIDEHGRATASMTAFGILPRFTGVAIHDAYSGYDGFTAATHALCNAHYSEVRVMPTSRRLVLVESGFGLALSA